MDGYRAAIASISTLRGLELVEIYDRAITAEDMIYHFRHLNALFDGPIAVFMDQLPAHKSKKLEKWCDEHDVMRIFNVAYSPKFNPIEGVFSQVKRYYVRERLGALVVDRPFD